MMKTAVLLSALLALTHGNDVPETHNGDRDKGAPNFLVDVQLRTVGYPQHVCYGAFIDERFILVPAQCVRTKPWLSWFEAVIGPETVAFDRIIFFPNATSDIENDIALVRLATILGYNDNIHPVNLPFPDNVQNTTATLYLKGHEGNFVNATIPMKKLSDCTDAPSPLGKGHYCAGDNVLSAVKGDEGSLLTIPHSVSGQVVIGLMSFAKPQPAPAVFTRVAYYTDWIVSAVFANV